MRNTLLVASIILSFLCMGNTASASTLISYQIIENATVWTPAEGPYLIDGWLSVSASGTLTILPGTIVKFGELAKLVVAGTLSAGGEGAPTVFTSSKDDTAGGDTNNDGEATAPASGDWAYIHFDAGSVGNFHNTHIAYGGRVWMPGFANYAMIQNGGGIVTVANANISKGTIAGVGGSAGTTTVRASTFAELHSAIVIPRGALTIGGNTFLNSVSSRGVFVSNYPDALLFTNEGGNSGTRPIVLSYARLASTTTLVSDTQPYLIDGWLSVQASTSLTILPGALVKFDSASFLTVDGTLNAGGGEGAPVVFTSLQDDSVGGDTNNNGTRLPLREAIGEGLL